MTAAGIAPIRPLDEEAALAWLRSQPGGRTTLRAAELGRRWGWHRQRTGRRLEGLADERKREAGTLAALQAERASGAAKARQLDAESAPIRYVAELVGADTDSERAIRWLIMLMVMCCDPLAIALTAAASAQRGRP